MNSKLLNIQTKIFMAFLIIFAISCTDGFEELNTPPTSSTTINPGIVLAKVQRDGNFLQSNQTSNCTLGSWVQYWNSSTNLPTSRYVFQNGDWGGYYGCIRNIAQIRNDLLLGKESTPEGKTKLAIAKIIEIDLWQYITDMWGDIPFSESALGEDKLIPQPKYDTQESIYKKLIGDLDAAIGNLDASDDSYGSYDLYYKGDVTKWIKYANSVKLQLGMRLKYVDPAFAKATVEAALSQPLISGNSDNAMVQTNTDYTSSYNPLLNHFVGGSPDLRYLAEAIVAQLVNTNDPRLTMIAAPTATSVKAGKLEYKGKAIALTDALSVGINNDDYSQCSNLTFFNLAYNQAHPIPQYVYTYSEICFYKAEAALESWGGLTPAQAEGFYQDGIRAAMALKPYEITTIPQTYIDAQFSFAGLTSEQKLEKIMTQKWIMYFGRSYSAYAEWRRTGYPVLTPGPNLGSTNGQIPRRVGYPANEALLNEKNYNEVVSRMSHGDSYLTKVWWDAKAK
ncbi:MAG: SusD/RagB family nutrient-binding outer membrane lipoprotein [Bacteroidales bacterium]|nr:SusD/RagB family nutrient-binding outer membrane lipoprotein [Bacteroidales bacterium]